MELQLTSFSGTDTDTGTGTSISDVHKAWHIFALLLSTGRPAHSSELSSKCILFSASPEFIEYLCSIPNSPLQLTTNYFVTFSSLGFNSTVKFFTNADADTFTAFVPQLEFRPRAGNESIMRTYYRKRKRGAGSVVEYSHKRGLFNNFDVKERSQVMMPLMAQRIFRQAYLFNGKLSCVMNPLTRKPLSFACDFDRFYEMFRTSWIIDGSARPSSSGLKSIEYECEDEIERGENCNEANFVHIPICKSKVPSHILFSSPRSTTFESITDSILQLNSYPASSFETTSTSTASEMVGKTEKKIKSCIKSCTIVDKEIEISLSAADASVHDFERMTQKVEDNKEEPFSYPINNRNIKCTMTHPTKANVSPQDDLPAENATKECTTSLLHVDTAKKDAPLQSHAVLPRTESFGQKQLGKSFPNSKPFQSGVLDHGEPRNSKAPKNHDAASLLFDKEQLKRDAKSISMKLKHKQNYDLGMGMKERKGNPKENGENFVCNSAKNQSEQNQLPNFESYIVEEEEGSGGYGTVYRARRKSDGVKFAIKCPHSNANKQHVHNELKMLERFGGKNFVIKYEGSFKNGSSDCLVLEHVEHDRPEVLKRDMDVSQLRWYGYCMFRALAGLHKQGIVHRDVKPGNFLFSRKVDKGYLIDFNLALDLHQKYGTSDKTKSIGATSIDSGLTPLAKPLPPIKQRNSTVKLEEGINKEPAKGVKSLICSKNLKRKSEQEKISTDIAYRRIIKSKGADGSGITSAKDATSNRTPSAERLREPLPCHGRKELISLVQEARQRSNHVGSNHVSTSGPTSKRKRVAATPGKVDNKYVFITPMPLHSSGITIGGAGLLKSKGDKKQKREGPCVGTKGFRAPEVLFRSVHQSTKLDIWSAGVTLLYFIIGRTPFSGDPEQNIKEIVKLKGSEDLWEVAKLHNRESSFPPDLFDTKCLSPVKLREWCARNTRKADFLEIIPQSLMDLVDKCLTSNPRLRISAEEALRHEFFAPCHEALRKLRLHRQGLSQEPQDVGSTLALPENSQSCGVL